MTEWTINGAGIESASLEVPPEGAWWVDAIVDRDVAPGPATCVFGDVEWLGTITSSDLDGGQGRLRIVGGAGGLSSPVSSQWLRGGISPGLIADQIAQRGGETVVEPPDGAIGRYQIFAETVGQAFSRLGRRMGRRWYTRSDGGIAFDTGAPIEVDAPGELLASTEQYRRFACSSFSFGSPASINGYVATHLRWTVNKDGAHLTAFDRGYRYDHDDEKTRAPRLGRVIVQAGDTVDVRLDDGWSLSGVPLFVGLPGVTVSLVPGVRVVVLWTSDDPSSAIAMLCPHGSPLTTSVDVATLGMAVGPIPAIAVPVLRLGDKVSLIDPSDGQPLSAKVTGFPAFATIATAVSSITNLPAALRVGDGIA